MKKILSISLLALVAFSSVSFSKAKVKVACVGDSITFGAKINDKSQRYPQQMQVMLGDDYEVVNFGLSGATLLYSGNKPYVKSKEYKGAVKFKPNVVVLKLGTNDSKADNWKKSKNFEADLNKLIDSFEALESKPKVYLCTPAFAYIESEDKITEKVIGAEIVPLIEKVAKERGLVLIDLHAKTSNKEEMFPDKIHPNAAGAKLIAESVRDAILKDK